MLRADIDSILLEMRMIGRHRATHDMCIEAHLLEVELDSRHQVGEFRCYSVSNKVPLKLDEYCVLERSLVASKGREI